MSRHKFKVGDKVRCIEGFSWPAGRLALTFGSENIVIEVCTTSGNVTFNGVEYWREDRFELVKEESNVKEFDLHQDKWFIRTPTKEAFKLAQLWAIEQGFAWVKGVSVNTDGTLYYPEEVESIGGNYSKSGLLGHGHREFYEENGHKEIKLTFKTVVDTVEYPEPELIETPSQKELRILKEQIAQLTQQANKLETTLKGEV